MVTGSGKRVICISDIWTHSNVFVLFFEQDYCKILKTAKPHDNLLLKIIKEKIIDQFITLFYFQIYINSHFGLKKFFIDICLLSSILLSGAFLLDFCNIKKILIILIRLIKTVSSLVSFMNLMVKNSLMEQYHTKHIFFQHTYKL